MSQRTFWKADLTVWDDGEREQVSEDEANLVSSLCDDGTHMAIIDLDIPHHYVPSSTEGHGHLYIDVPMSWSLVKGLLSCLASYDVIQGGFLRMSLEREMCFVRRPGVTKADGEYVSDVSHGDGDSGMSAPHPAKFSAAILPVVVEYLRPVLLCTSRVIDPMAGVGTLAHYAKANFLPGEWYSSDLEREWIEQALKPGGVWDARDLPVSDGFFDGYATSCSYGNRMSDHHEAKDSSKRHTYTHYLGRKLSPGNTGAMPWGPLYRQTHEEIWAEAWRVLRPGGRLVLNVSDFYKTIKKGEQPQQQHVSGWHATTLLGLGFVLLDYTMVQTPRMRHGANGLRMGYENVYCFEKPINPTEENGVAA